MALHWAVKNLFKNSATICAGLVAGALATVDGGLISSGLLIMLSGFLGIQTALAGDGGDAKRQTIETWLMELVKRHGSLEAAVDAIRTGVESHELVSIEHAEALHDILTHTESIEEHLIKHESLLTYGLDRLGQWLAEQDESLDSLETKLNEIIPSLQRIESGIADLKETFESSVRPAISTAPDELYWPQPYIREGSRKLINPFVGRDEERSQIDTAFNDGHSVICINGMAGEGKSSLIGQLHFEHEDRFTKHGLLWCRPYETGYTIARFLTDAITYISQGQADLTAMRTEQEQVEYLCKVLRQRPTLFMLDGIERWLRKWIVNPDASGEDATADDRAGAHVALDYFLADASSWTNGSRIIMTTRAIPSVLEGLRYATIGTASQAGNRHMKGLDEESAIKLLIRLGVQDDDRIEIAKAAEEYQHHALTLSILGTLLAREYGGDVTRRPEVDLIKDDSLQRLKKLLDKVVQHHQENYPLLAIVAGCLGASPLEMIANLLKADEKETRHRLGELMEWHLIEFDGRVIELHSLIKLYILDSIEDPVLLSIRQGIGVWYLKREMPSHPTSYPQVEHLVLSARHFLESGDISHVLNILYSKPRQDSHYIFVQWLDAFGFMTIHIEMASSLVKYHEDLSVQDSSHKVLETLTMCLNNRGLAWRAQGNLPAAIEDFDHAIEILTTLVEQEGQGDLRNELAKAHNNRGLVSRAQGNLPAAIEDYDLAISIYTTLVEQEGQGDLRNDLALAHNNRGAARRFQGNLPAAIEDFDRAISIYTTLVEQEGRGDLRNDLANAHLNRGATCSAQGNLPAAIEDLDHAIEILTTLVEQEGRGDLRNGLAMAHSNRGNARSDQGNLPAAIEDLDLAIAIITTLVKEEGRGDLRYDLAIAHIYRGATCRDHGNLPAAIEDYDRAIGILTILVKQEGRGDLRNDLASAHNNRGNTRSEQGDLPAAIEDYTVVIDMGDAVSVTRQARALQGRGMVYELQKQPELARIDYERVMEMKNVPDEIREAVKKRLDGLGPGQEG